MSEQIPNIKPIVILSPEVNASIKGKISLVVMEDCEGSFIAMLPLTGVKGATSKVSPCDAIAELELVLQSIKAKGGQ